MNDNLIDHKKITPMSNYVLIKADENMEKYHFNGKETEIYIGTSYMKYIDEHDSLDFEMKETVDSFAQHWPISGQVIAIPKQNKFYGHEVSKFMSRISDDGMTPEDMSYARHRADSSLKFESEVEVLVGDTVYYDYLSNIHCYDHGMYFHTDIGTLILIKYDQLTGKKSNGEIYPLNDNIFFEWNKYKTIGSFSAVDKEIQDVVGVQKGTVTHVGTKLPFMITGTTLKECHCDYEINESIWFRPHDCAMIESQLHLHIFDGREIYTISRRDIIIGERMLKQIE